MVSMLLNGGGRQHQQRGLARQRVHLLPTQIGEVAGIGNPRLHHALPVVATSSARNVIIFPGLSSPLGSYRILASNWTLSARYRPPPSTLFTCGFATNTPIPLQ